MTEKRKTTDPAAEHDAAVCRAYRETATERVPEHLDRAVLEAAAQAARPAYSRLRFWTRPAAWAAVVMLSVALIVETGQVPLQQTASPTFQEVANDDDSAYQPGTGAAGAEDRAAAEVAERKAEAPARKSEPAETRQSPPGAQEMRSRDAAVAGRAERIATTRQNRDDQPEPSPAASLPAAPLQASDELANFAKSLEELPPACDEAAKAEPETWLRCIRELEDAGFVDAARDERDQLDEAFPDFASR
jgi:hypothetical protein